MLYTYVCGVFRYFSDCAKLLDMLKQWEDKFSVQLSEVHITAARVPTPTHPQSQAHHTHPQTHTHTHTFTSAHTDTHTKHTVYVCLCVVQQRALHDDERKKLSALREKVKTAMGMGKNLDNRASMQPSVSSTEKTVKSGFLLMKPRGALAVLRL